MRAETLAKREMKESAARLAAWEKMAWDTAMDSDMPFDSYPEGSQHDSHNTQMGLSASAAGRHDSYQEQLVLAATLRESTAARAALPGRNESHMSEPLPIADFAELGLSLDRKPRSRRSRRSQSATSPCTSPVIIASKVGAAQTRAQSPDDELQRVLAASAQEIRQDEDAALQAALQASMQMDNVHTRAPPPSAAVDGPMSRTAPPSRPPPVQQLGAKRILI